jgi:hypothetical protein
MTAASAATGTAAGTIVHVYTYGDGRVLVTGLSFSNNYCSNNGGFWVDGAHPHLQRILALVLSAQASGATVTVTAKTDNCWYPEITQDPSTYVIVTKT